MKELRDYQLNAVSEAVSMFRAGTDPVLIEASVGAGKTLMIADAAKNTCTKGGVVLVIADQGELVEQNSGEAWEYGLPNSIYAASLGLKQTSINPVFAMRQSLHNALDSHPFSSMKVDLMIFDEAHKFDFLNDESTAYKIINHFYKINPKMRVLGLTGTPYRGVTPIYGDDQFFKRKTENNISTDYLTENGWLVEAHYGLHDSGEEIDFSGLEIRHNEETGGNYSEEDFDRILQGEYQRTLEICARVHSNAQKMENGCLIFCGSKLHTEQVKYGLVNAGAKPETIAIVTDDTSPQDRKAALDGARSGKIKYFVNVSIASTGWNCEPWEYEVLLKPIGSLTFFLQAKGRALRPFLTDSERAEFNAKSTTAKRRKEIIKNSRKPFSVIDDYAGVIERLAPYLEGNFEIEEAKRQRDIKKGETKVCPICSFENSQYAQRCVNQYEYHHLDGSFKVGRCLHYWQYNECRDKNCVDELGRRTQNAVTAKECRVCSKVLIDPNKALLNKAYRDDEYREVKNMRMKVDKSGQGVVVYFDLSVADPDIGTPFLHFNLKSKQGKISWKRAFVDNYVNSQLWREKAYNMSPEAAVKSLAMFNRPKYITVRKNHENKFVIAKRMFLSGRESIDNCNDFALHEEVL